MTERARRRLGVYGGSFDPIHRGHLGPVEEVRRRLEIDEVLFVPAHQPPHKPTGASASSHHRFAMAALALAPFEAFRLSDYEVARGGTTYTIETLRHVRAIHPDHEVVLLMGSDSLVTFATWRSWQEIARDYAIGVVYREPFTYAETAGKVPAELWARMAPEEAIPGNGRQEAAEKSIFWGGNAPVTISSTWLRRAIPAGEDLHESLPPAVEQYLRRHALYRAP